MIRKLIKSGTIQFDRKFRELIEELRHFPKGKNDDGIDALEMAVKICQTAPYVDMWFEGSSKQKVDPNKGGINPSTGLYDPNLPIYDVNGPMPYNYLAFNRGRC